MKNEENTTTKEDCQGIQFPGSLRDWFAGMAMQGVFSFKGSVGRSVEVNEIARIAYAQADAMIERRKW
jgi:hypothetical protein